VRKIDFGSGKLSDRGLINWIEESKINSSAKSKLLPVVLIINNGFLPIS
jgi:hypothetical protein